MSVRQSLLAILDQGPCYGYQLRAEFGRRTGARWPLNVGQIYHTLERLERDGLAAKEDVDAQGHVYWRITDAGRVEVRGWLSTPVERDTSARDELAVKLSIAASLPGADLARLLSAERAAAADRLAAAERARPTLSGPEGVAAALVHEALVQDAEADVRLIERAGTILGTLDPQARTLPLSPQHPPRGRPRRV